MGLLPNVILNECEGSQPFENIEILRCAQNDRNGKEPFGNSPNIEIVCPKKTEQKR